MFCKNCGTELTDGNKFCKNCGAKIESDKNPDTNQSEEVEQQEAVNIGENAVSQKSKKDDEDKKRSEMATDEKIETVYGMIFLIILVILGIKYHSEIAFAWRIADSKIAFIIHSIDYLGILSIWGVPLYIIETIYFAIKKKARKALYQFALIPGCIICSIIAAAVLGNVGAEIVFFIAAAIIEYLLKLFKERVVNKDDVL